MTWAVTTTNDCYGQPAPYAEIPPDGWCVYDMDEDDPPIVEGLSFEMAEWIAERLNHCTTCEKFKYLGKTGDEDQSPPLF